MHHCFVLNVTITEGQTWCEGTWLEGRVGGQGLFFLRRRSLVLSLHVLDGSGGDGGRGFGPPGTPFSWHQMCGHMTWRSMTRFVRLLPFPPQCYLLHNTKERLEETSYIPVLRPVKVFYLVRIVKKVILNSLVVTVKGFNL